MLVESDGEAIGFAGLSRDDRGRQIEHLWILPLQWDAGLGRKLFAEMIQLAQLEGTAELFIYSDPTPSVLCEDGAVRIGQEVYLLPDGNRREVPLLVYRCSDATIFAQRGVTLRGKVSTPICWGTKSDSARICSGAGAARRVQWMLAHAVENQTTKTTHITMYRLIRFAQPLVSNAGRLWLPLVRV